ncbi:MAG: hypothetical protein IT463_04605 [Planctomycetes bacterium]|nr:hypothetical protein [Planctomycetota bacterium]
MARSVRRWTQRNLLYPLAIFAIIGPTVVLGLFGAYALREVELRPSLYRQELSELQQGLEIALEMRLRDLAVTPPRTADDIPAARAAVETYFSDYTRALAGQAYVGIGGTVHESLAVDGTRGKAAPAVLMDALAHGHPDGGRRTLSLEVIGGNESRHLAYVIYGGGPGAGFVAWELQPNEIDRFVASHLPSLDLGNDSLSTEVVDRSQVNWRTHPGSDSEMVGYVPVHETLHPGRYVALQLDTGAQFYKDSTFLSTMFIVIAVLCVPVVSSASLMAVHMILREASEARKKVDFVSNVTHELKTPLTSIRMFVETLKLGRVKNPEQVNACLDTIMNETNRLSALIDHVLSFSKLENQVKKYNFQPANLAQVVRDTIGLFKGQIANVKGEIRLKVTPGLPTRAVFDKDGIREVLLNLLSNSIKYSGDDKFVTVVAGIDCNDLFIEVADRGIGIDPEHHQRIFEKFFRVDQDRARKVDGTGLGLAICREIVQAHGGRITLDSARGRGSRFTVFIPYRAPGGSGLVQPRTTETVMPSGNTEVMKSPDSSPLRSAMLAAGAALLGLAGAVAGARAQPDRPPGNEPAAEKPKGSLLPRPDVDAATESWVKKLGGLRPQAVTVEVGSMLRHCLTPEGDRLYYFRKLPQAEGDKAAPRFALYTAGPQKIETRVTETGAAAVPPLFLADGRMVLVTRRADTSGDGALDGLDDGELLVMNRDGGAARSVATLAPGEVPVAAWREGKEVLLSEPAPGEANGWITSLHLLQGTRTRLVRGFNVELVLEGNKLLFERMQVPPKKPEPEDAWRRGWEEDEEPEPEAVERPPQLTDPSEHVLYDPADGSQTLLYSPTTRSRLSVCAEGSFYGSQEASTQAADMQSARRRSVYDITTLELLIVDDADHRDTRAPSARYNYQAVGWIKERGLLALEEGKLASRLLLLDRALKVHSLGELDLSVRGLRASAGGLTIAWLQVEDTDKNGLLEPWKDTAKPYFCTIE